jgi:phosphomannomutase
MTETTPEVDLDPETKMHVDAWLSGPYDEESKEKIRTMLKSNPSEITDAFYKNLTFGTGGMRGLMGVGTNRMNLYTVRSATQGLVNHLLAVNPNKTLAVFIGYDSRRNSKEFAEEAAKVAAGNGIKVFLSSDLRPTPWVSFGCRFKQCDGAIMITASHNPPEYNGYKVYGSDGAQMIPPQDQEITEQIHKITDFAQIKSVDSVKNPLIEYVGDEVDDAYLEGVKGLALFPKVNREQGASLHIIYTSLHGTGITLAPRNFRLWGFPRVSFVETQITPNPDFPTARIPDPGELETLALGIEKLIEKKGDILIANDPDADRVSVVAMHENAPFKFTGNQIACICIEHICRAYVDQQKSFDRGAFVKTIVTTELFRAIAERYGAKCLDVLTGFKYIGELIRNWEKNPDGYHYIFGAEESYGYLLGTIVRDKDAISASALIAEIALQAKMNGKTLVDLLHDLYKSYGIYHEITDAVKFEDTKEGHDRMQKAMQALRLNPFNEIDGFAVAKKEDYSLALPASDLLVYWLEDGSKLMVRPSGTEAKIKIYCGIIQKEFENIESGQEQAAQRAKDLTEAIKELLTNNQ